MTRKQQSIISLLGMGKNYFEIAHALKINLANVHSTVYQLRKKGVDVRRRYKYASTHTRPLTPAQRSVLERYAQHTPIPTIAKLLGITCQTVQNHASQGFRRLGFVASGVDRIAQLKAHFASIGENTEKATLPISMADPFFN